MREYKELIERARTLLNSPRHRVIEGAGDRAHYAMALIALARELRESGATQSTAPATEEIPTPPDFTGFTMRLHGSTGCGKTTVAGVLRAQGYIVDRVGLSSHTEDYLVWPPGQAPKK